MHTNNMVEHKCDKCNYVAADKAALAQHLQRKTPCDEGKYLCTHCAKPLQSKDTLRNHDKTCSGRKKTREELQLDNTFCMRKWACKQTQATNTWQLLAMRPHWLPERCMTSWVNLTRSMMPISLYFTNQWIRKTHRTWRALASAHGCPTDTGQW